MFLRCKVRKKNGKEHRSWSIVENRRVAGGRVVQRHVLYLGEINDSQQLAWRKSVEMFPEQEHCREPARGGRPSGAAARALSGRDQRLPTTGLAQIRRDVSRAGAARDANHGGAVCRRRCGGGRGGGGGDCPAATAGVEVGRSTTVGGLLAGAAPVAGVGVGQVLGGTLASQPQRHSLGSGAGGADVLPGGFGTQG